MGVVAEESSYGLGKGHVGHVREGRVLMAFTAWIRATNGRIASGDPANTQTNTNAPAQARNTNRDTVCVDARVGAYLVWQGVFHSGE